MVGKPRPAVPCTWPARSRRGSEAQRRPSAPRWAAAPRAGGPLATERGTRRSERGTSPSLPCLAPETKLGVSWDEKIVLLDGGLSLL